MSNPHAADSPPTTTVCAIIITYHPDGDFGERVARVLPQVPLTMIIDNGSSEPALTLLRGLSAHPAILVIENGGNLGVARALNIGIEAARTRGYSWTLLLDQDTEVDGDMVDHLCSIDQGFPDRPHLAVVGAGFRDIGGRPAETLPLGPSGTGWREVESVITSGSLLSLAAYAAIGPFRDDFFIDYVDTEYCLRARAAGYRIIETRKPLMSHTVGTPTPHRFLWQKKWTTNHSAERRYYIARNNTVMLREYGGSDGQSWRSKSLLRCYRLCKRILFYEGDKRRKIIAVGQGWWDAVHGNMGPRKTR